MDKDAIDALCEEIFTLLGDQLGARGKTLEKRFVYAGRLVPKRARVPVETMIDAQRLAQSPQLALRVDGVGFEAAYKEAKLALDGVDPASETSRRRYNSATVLAAQLLVVGIGFFYVMRWRGFL